MRDPRSRPSTPTARRRFDDCACVGGPETASIAAPAAIELGAKPDAPIACTLDGAAMANRMGEWHSIVEQATGRFRVDDGSWRFEFEGSVSVAELASLVAAEHDC